MSFSHPVKLVADTCYWYFPSMGLIRGSIKLKHKDPKYLYLLADDSCRFNQVVGPNGIGVTAFMDFKLDNPNFTKNLDIEVKITKQERSKSGRLKSFINGRIFNLSQTFCTYNGLFVESPMIYNEIKVGQEPFIIERTTFTNTRLDIKDLIETNDYIHWKDGFGPKNHVHGGISVFPIFDQLSTIKRLTVEYRKPIPLLSFSNLFIRDSRFAIKELDSDEIQVCGQYSL